MNAALHEHAGAVRAAREQRRHRHRRRPNARQGLEALHALLKEAGSIGGVELGRAWDRSNEHEVVRVVPDVDALEVVERSEKQTRPNEQHERNRHLRHEQASAEDVVRARDAAAAFFQRGSDIDARRLKRRRDAEDHADEGGDGGHDCQRAHIERARRADRRRQQLLTAVGDQDAERAAHAGEQQAFGQQLPDQPRARRSHRQADGQLALAEPGARKEQVRDVRAYQQQHQRRDDGDDLERANIVGIRVVDALPAAFGNQLRARRRGCGFRQNSAHSP